MSKNCVLLIIIALIALTSCADSHLSTRIETKGVKLDENRSIYISQSEDEQYGNIAYPNSGANTTQIIKASFLKNTNNVNTASQPESLASAIVSAKMLKCEFLVYPIILHWKDRATEWLVRPDKVEVKIILIETVSQKNGGIYHC